MAPAPRNEARATVGLLRLVSGGKIWLLVAALASATLCVWWWRSGDGEGAGASLPGGVETEDLFRRVERSLDVEDLPLDAKGMEALEKRAPGDFRVRVLSARVLYRKGFPVKALGELEGLLGEKPESRYALAAKGRMLWASPSLEDRVAGKVLLRELATGKDYAAYAALQALAFGRLGKGAYPDDLLEAARTLRKHPQAMRAVALRALEVELALEPVAKRESLLDEAEARFGGGRDKAELARWLVGLKRPDRALKLVSENEAANVAPLFMPRFQALLETNATAAARELLRKAAGKLERMERAKAEAYLGLARKDPDAARRYLETVRAEGAGRDLVEAGRLALLSGNGDLALAAYGETLERFPDELGRAEANQLLQLALNARDTALALKVAKSSAKRFPYRWGARNNAVYLGLLSGGEPGVLEAEAERVVRAVPTNPNFITTLALAKLLAGKAKEAAELMDRRGTERLLPGERALAAAVSYAAGEPARAGLLMEGMTPERMLPEEWSLPERFRKGG